MTATKQAPLVVRSRVSPWGFVVALALGALFVLGGLKAIEQQLLPPKLGVFVAPPHWLIGALMLAFAAFLFLVGVAELARYIRPAAEVVVDRDGIATFGLLGERRGAWRDIIAAEQASGVLMLKLRAKGRMPPTDMRIHFDRLDVDAETLLAHIHAYRADLVTPVGGGDGRGVALAV